MPQYIIHKDGAYNFYSTIVNVTIFVSALTLEQVKSYYKDEYGNSGMKELPDRLERAEETGCSSRLSNLKECLSCNVAGKDGTEMSFDDFVAKYLTLQQQQQKEIKDD